MDQSLNLSAWFLSFISRNYKSKTSLNVAALKRGLPRPAFSPSALLHTYSMASFCHDESRLREYARRAQLLGPVYGSEACSVDVLEWPPGIYIHR